jgi:hypothetical protein
MYLSPVVALTRRHAARPPRTRVAYSRLLAPLAALLLCTLLPLHAAVRALYVAGGRAHALARAYALSRPRVRAPQDDAALEGVDAELEEEGGQPPQLNELFQWAIGA